MSNPWGSAVTLFRTVQGTPYFFNFHQQQVGHTLILGPHASGKSTLTNFLLSESFKYHPKILVIDHHKRTELLFKATGNLYKQVGLNSNTPNYNPLLLPDNEENRAFLRKWFSYLINQHSDEYKTENEQLIAQAVNLLYELPVEMRQLKHLERLFPPGEDQGCQRIIKALEIWRGEGKFSQLFDNEQDIFEQLDNNIVAFDITNLYENKAEVVLPLVMYYFHRFSNWLDGKPAIIVINDAFEIFENQGFNTEILPWLDYLSTKSAICIMTSEIKTGKTIPLWHEEIVRKCATHIFLPNNAAINFPKLFNLTIKECEMAKSMTTLSRHFLLKQGKDTIMAELNLAGLENITAILSGQEQTAIQIEEIVKEAGEDPDKWLPIFYERYK
jgi:type IV secretion system protein VirB4